MYAPSIVRQRLELAKSVLGWTPEYHSVDEVDSFARHIAASERPDDKGNLVFSRDLTYAEHRFIENERVLSAADAGYWLTRYCFVSDETNTAVRFRFRPIQRVFFSVISDLEERGYSIELLIAKARQQYITTVTQLLLDHRVFYYHDVNAISASADQTKSEEMARKTFFTYDHLPWWNRPDHTRRVEAVPGLFEFGGIGSRVSFLHGAGIARTKGGQATGIARGTTPTVYALSEASSFPRPEQQIEAAIFRAVHASPKVLGFVESTFAGNTGWFVEKFDAATDLWPKGMSRLCPIFIPWPCAIEVYPSRTWLRMHPIPGDWRPVGKILEQIRKAELYIQNDSILSHHYGTDYAMPIEQQWFYFVSYNEAEQSGTLPTFRQEMAVDPYDARISSFDSVFGHDTIELISSRRERQFDVYGIVGQSIEDRYEPHDYEIDYSRPRKVIRQRSPRGIVYVWELVPLRYELYADIDGKPKDMDLADSRLFVYRQPRQGMNCAMGVDSSTGVGSDMTVISVCSIGRDGLPDVQVAELRSHFINHVEAWAFALPIALFFRNLDAALKDTPLSLPLVGIEQIAAVGDVCQGEMRKCGYPTGRFFNFGRYDGKKGVKQATNKLGWYTVGWSREMLIGNFVHVVKNGWYIANSPFLIEECRNFEVHLTVSGKEKLEHSKSSHDDGIFAGAISTFICHDTDTLANRSKRRYQEIDTDYLPPIDVGDYPGSTVISSDQLRGASKPLTFDDIVGGGEGLDRYIF